MKVPVFQLVVFNHKENELNRFQLDSVGFFQFANKKLKLIKNLLEVNQDEYYFEIIQDCDLFYIIQRNYIEQIRNKRIYQKDFFDNLLGLKVTSYPWKLVPGDMIKIKNKVYLVGGFQYDNDIDIIRYQEVENTSQLTELNKQSFFQEAVLRAEHCFICQKNSGSLFSACDCSFVHHECMKKKYQQYGKVRVVQKTIELTIKNYFCKKCQKFYSWQSKSNSQRKLLISKPDEAPSDNYLILIQYQYFSDISNSITLYFLDLSKRHLEFLDLFNVKTILLPNNVKTPTIVTKHKNALIYSFSQKQFDFKESKTIQFSLNGFHIDFQAIC